MKIVFHRLNVVYRYVILIAMLFVYLRLSKIEQSLLVTFYHSLYVKLQDVSHTMMFYLVQNFLKNSIFPVSFPFKKNIFL